MKNAALLAVAAVGGLYLYQRSQAAPAAAGASAWNGDSVSSVVNTTKPLIEAPTITAPAAPAIGPTPVPEQAAVIDASQVHWSYGPGT